jgi:hypothetical protein
MSVELLDSAGRPQSPATLPGYRLGRPPRHKGRRYSADRREWRRSSPSCASPGLACTACACERWS